MNLYHLLKVVLKKRNSNNHRVFKNVNNLIKTISEERRHPLILFCLGKGVNSDCR